MSLVVAIKSSDAYELNTWEMLAIFERNAWICFLCLTAVLVCGASVIHFVADPLHLPAESLVQAIAFTGSTLILKSYRYTVEISKAGKLIYLATGFISLVMFAYLRAGKTSMKHVCYHPYWYHHMDCSLTNGYATGGNE